MIPNPMRCTLVGGAVVAFALITSPAMAAEATNAAPDAAPIVVAQASAPAAARVATPYVGESPMHLRGVRQAATEGPEALRRYIWRTRMIYNFWYDDFAPKE